MKQQIENLLISHGYSRISASLPEFTIYYTVSGGQAIVVHVIDYKPAMSLSKDQYGHILKQICDMFAAKGFSGCQMLSLFLTETPEKVKELCINDPMSWILDTCDKRLLVYEGQIREFYGLRGLIENTLLSGAVPPHTAYTDSDPDRRYARAVREKGFLGANVSPVNMILILINVIIFLGLEIFGSTNDIAYMVDHGAMFPPYLRDGHQYYRLFTCMFLHFGFQHLFSNMIALFFLGDNVERALGKVKYLLLYLVSGLGASGLSLMSAVIFGNDVVSAGASGAIFGVVGALLYIVIKNHGHLEDMTTARVAIMIAYCLFSGFTSQGIDNAAHVGGLITGFLLAVLLYHKKADS